MPKRGKTFETEMGKALRAHPDVGWLHRPQDPTWSDKTRFAKNNPIDLMGCLKNGLGLFVECKTVKGINLPFSRFGWSQWLSLRRCHRSSASVWIALNIYGQPGRHGMRGEAFLIPYAKFLGWHAELRKLRKSWSVETLINDSFFPKNIRMKKVAGGWEWPSKTSLI